MILRFKVVIVK